MRKFVLLISLIAGMGAVLFAQNAALPRLAVVEFTTNVNTERVKADAVTMRNLVEAQMISSGRFQMITRGDIDKLLENQRIQVSSISSAENIKKLQMQNISYIVTGSVDTIGDDYAITVKLLDVSTGGFPNAKDGFMGGTSRAMYDGIKELMTSFIAGITSTGDRVTQLGRVYKLGDFGPAGGYIFYDKGVFSGGWRYLESVPAEIEFAAQWGGYTGSGSNTSDYYYIPGIETRIGSGKRNTQLILERLNQLGENGRAAQLCASLNYDGFTDWFLPSKDELDLMYKNLKQKGLGGFRSSGYWSSSQDLNSTAWVQDFEDGRQVYSLTKYLPLYVRAVRQF